MVKEIKRDDKTYFVCDCDKMSLVWIKDNKKICSHCGFRIEDEFKPYLFNKKGVNE